jgi:LPS-assembly lipoprotein
LSGCGFRPLYGSGQGAGREELATVRIDLIPDRVGQQLRNDLLDRFNPRGEAKEAAYRLSVTVQVRRVETAIRRDETTRTVRLEVDARYSLVELGNSVVAASGISRAATTFTVFTSEFATLSAENDARTRAVREIADDLALRIGSVLARDRTEGS